MIKALLALELADSFNKRADSDQEAGLFCLLIGDRPELSAVLGEACPLYVHFVSDPLPYCLTVTTASPVERARKEKSKVKVFTFHSQMRRSVGHVFEREAVLPAARTEGDRRAIVIEVRSLKMGRSGHWLLFETAHSL